MPTSAENVAKLYGSIAEHESARLANHPMERELTLRTVRHGLASMPAASAAKRIADVGGGPGKLAFALADDGHKVDLVDLSPDLIRLAQNEQAHRGSTGSGALLASIIVGNALDYPPSPVMTEASYDAVLLLGPLYHLLDDAERKTAVENACRLAKPKTGLIFCAFVSIEAHLRDLAMREPARLLEQKKFYDQYVRTHRALGCSKLVEPTLGTLFANLRFRYYSLARRRPL
jgi:SAM-dependent methyltransferase